MPAGDEATSPVPAPSFTIVSETLLPVAPVHVPATVESASSP
jgi:hypothetical protein